MKDDRYIHARTCVYNIHYHIVWCVKYRRKVLTPDIEKSLQQILHYVAAENASHLTSARLMKQTMYIAL